MRDFRDAKSMAQTLREALKLKSVSLTHSESLELVAKILGFHDWNELSARIQSENRPEVARPAIIIIPAPAALSIGRRADLPTVALRDIVLFPQMITPIFVGRDTTKRAIERAMVEDRCVLAVTQRRSGDDNPRRADIYDVGVIASVIDRSNLGDGTIKLLVKSLQRVAIVQLIEGPFLAAEVVGIEETRGNDEEALVLSRTVVEELQARRKFQSSLFSIPQDPSLLADAIAPLLSCEISQKQELLETTDVIARLEKVLALVKNERQAA
jgi:ATP-dependent Lon protease